MPGCLAGTQGFGFCDRGSTFEKLRLLAADGVHLTKWGKKEWLCQQAGQTYKESSKVDLVGEGGGVLRNREEPGAADG